MVSSPITLYILVTPKCVLWQKVKTQIKCRIMRHFIRVYTVGLAKTYPEKEIHFYFEIIACDPWICTMDYPKFNVYSAKKSNELQHSMCKNFVSKSIFKNRISHCSAATARRKTVFCENLFIIEFCPVAVESRKGHSKRSANLHWFKDCQIPACAGLKWH